MNKTKHHIQKYFYLVTAMFLLWNLSAQADNAQEVTLGPNLITNDGFENGAAGWSIPAGTAKIVEDTAHNGARSLFYSNMDTSKYVQFTQRLAVKGGDHLHFSVWVKGQDVIGKKTSQGAGIYLESYDANGTYLEGTFNQTFSGTFDWKLAKGEYTVPVDAVRTTVGLYLRPRITGTAWFDDAQVRVEQEAAFSSFLQFPNYRGILKHGDNTPWKFLVRANTLAHQESTPIKVTTILTNANEKVLFDKSSEVTATNKGINVAFQAPRDLPLGKYILKQNITGLNKSHALESQHSIQVVSEMPTVYIDAEGFTMVNNKRFFPLGVYLGPTEDEHLQRISEGGFNTILCYGYGKGIDPEAYLDRAAKHDLKVVYTVNRMYPGYRSGASDSFEQAASYMKLLRDKPALLAWYINDEMTMEWLPKIQRMYRQVTDLDPNHPAYQVLARTGDVGSYFNTTDVLGTDPYPVGKGADLTRTSSHTRAVMDATHGVKGSWMVPQIMDWAVYTPGRAARPTTRDEMRNQAYQAIINGATGLIFYSYYDLFNEKYPRDNTTRNMKLFEKSWADAASMATEIDSIIPAILNGKHTPIVLSAATRIEVSALEYQDELLILLANPYYQKEEVTIDLPTGWAVKQSAQGEIKSIVKGKQISFTLASVGSGVFRLERLK